MRYGDCNGSCAPGDWFHVEHITGDYDLDLAISKTHNRAARAMLGMHIATDADEPAYSHRTGYGGKVGAY